EKVEMKMIDGLSAVVAAVNDGAKTLVGQSERLCRLLNGLQGAAHEGGILNVHDRLVVRFRNQQDMDGSLGVQIAEREKLLVLIDRLDRDLFRRDAAKDALVWHKDTPVTVRIFSGPMKDPSRSASRRKRRRSAGRLRRQSSSRTERSSLPVRE